MSWPGMTAPIKNNLFMSPTIRIRFLTAACLLLIGGRCIAQENTRDQVTVDLKKTSYADLLKELERQAGYRFYYDTSDFDSTKIDIRADRQPFYTVLTQAFSGTEISFSIDRYRQVF